MWSRLQEIVKNSKTNLYVLTYNEIIFWVKAWMSIKYLFEMLIFITKKSIKISVHATAQIKSM